MPPRTLRSWLFVPGDSERKQEKALASAADAVILDLEDSVAPEQLPAARQRVSELLGSVGEHRRGPQLWVRVNAASSGLLGEDLAAVFARAAPAGIVVPKVSGAADIVLVARQLSRLETRLGLEPGAARLLVIATETPAGVLSLAQYPQALGGLRRLRERVAGLTWGAEDLGTALGALAARDAAGALTFTFQLARSHCLLAAAALGAQAIDGVCTDFRDGTRLQHELDAARRDGFSGKLAIHPDQIAAINAAFAPTEAEREHARRVVAAFATAPAAGVVSLDGRMIDRPHLLQAQRILAAAQNAEGS
ncbi:MAG: CoA ester lyase [Gammaproteobacteria bacterium]|nr:CoA ester lyase [Gammaproteobacteria bacterium]MBV9727722.1 CoA ester lyase [Gammaproteobacteria bacterium]